MVKSKMEGPSVMMLMLMCETVPCCLVSGAAPHAYLARSANNKRTSRHSNLFSEVTAHATSAASTPPIVLDNCHRVALRLQGLCFTSHAIQVSIPPHQSSKPASLPGYVFDGKNEL